MKMTTFLQLLKPRRDLIRLCQSCMTDGDVSFDVPPAVFLDVKLDGDFEQRPELDLMTLHCRLRRAGFSLTSIL